MQVMRQRNTTEVQQLALIVEESFKTINKDHAKYET